MSITNAKHYALHENRLYHISVTQPVFIVPVLVFWGFEVYLAVLLSVFGQHTVSDSVHPPPDTAAHLIQRFATGGG